MAKKILLMMLIMLATINFAYATASGLSADNQIMSGSRHDGRVNTFLATHDSMLNFLISAILLFVALVSFSVDFRAVGVTSVALFALIAMWAIGIIYVDATSLISFTIMAVILIVKLSTR